MSAVPGGLHRSGYQNKIQVSHATESTKVSFQNGQKESLKAQKTLLRVDTYATVFPLLNHIWWAAV